MKYIFYINQLQINVRIIFKKLLLVATQIQYYLIFHIEGMFGCNYKGMNQFRVCTMAIKKFTIYTPNIYQNS